MKFKNLIESIGDTPLTKIPLDRPQTFLAKLEYLNPGGSVKDRSALYMIEKAEREGLLKPGGTIIDASSGNQGIASAMIGAAKGYKVIITVSEKSSQEKVDTIRAYGAEVVTCPATEFIENPESYHSQAVRIHNETPNSFMPNQYFNPWNRDAHETLLGPEVWEQTEGKVTHFFAGAGTAGTVSGVGRYLKKKNPDIKIFAVDSENSLYSTNGHPKPYKLEGLGMDFISPVMDHDVVDEVVAVEDEGPMKMLKTLAKEYGFLVGPSSGAVAYAATQTVVDKLPEDAIVVMIFGDSGRAYLTKGYYQ